jgi:NhaP-type Na+/H+ or K+/H+ antiporter
MTTNQILFGLGLGLVLVLAVGCQLLARRLRIPAIVVLLPAGFIAGIATDDVNPENLLGDLYQPFVSLAVGVILFEAGLRLSFGEIALGAHRVVVRLVGVGVVLTCASVAVTVALLFAGMSYGVALQIGAILVVSGPTVVLPLLAFIRPARAVRSTLKWEGVIVDPVGALLGVFVFHLVSSGWQPGEFLISMAVGVLVGAAGAAVLWLLLREVHLNEPRMTVLATLMVVVAAVVAADLLREDSGFVAATLMGISLGNQRVIAPARRIDVSLTREFQESLVQLLIGVLFVLISASVSPSDLEEVLPEALVLVLVMVLLVRPAVVALATLLGIDVARAGVRRVDGTARHRCRRDGFRIRARARAGRARRRRPRVADRVRRDLQHRRALRVHSSARRPLATRRWEAARVGARRRRSCVGARAGARAREVRSHGANVGRAGGRSGGSSGSRA